MRVDLERQKLAPGGGAVHMRLSLAGTDVAPGERPHLSVHLVLDVSGSMRHPLSDGTIRIDSLKAAVKLCSV